MAKAKPLGRRVPSDWRHYEKYPLTAATTPTTPMPVAIGVNWYEDFDNPVQKGSRYWIGSTPRSSARCAAGTASASSLATSSTATEATRLLQDSQGWWTSTTRAARALASASAARG